MHPTPIVPYDLTWSPDDGFLVILQKREWLLMPFPLNIVVGLENPFDTQSHCCCGPRSDNIAPKKESGLDSSESADAMLFETMYFNR